MKSAGCYGRTPLMNACKKGHESIAMKLIDLGADVNGKDDGGWTALYWACLNGLESIVFNLVQYGATFDGLSDEHVQLIQTIVKNEMKKLKVEKTVLIELDYVDPIIQEIQELHSNPKLLKKIIE